MPLINYWLTLTTGNLDLTNVSHCMCVVHVIIDYLPFIVLCRRTNNLIKWVGRKSQVLNVDCGAGDDAQHTGEFIAVPTQIYLAPEIYLSLFKLEQEAACSASVSQIGNLRWQCLQFSLPSVNSYH